MKTMEFVCLMMMLGAIGYANAQDASSRQWSVTLTVVDDSGLPVTNAQVVVSYSLPTPFGEELKSGRTTGFTDGHGLFSATHDDTGSQTLGLQIEKNGYYPVQVIYDVSGKHTPEKWNLNPTWTLKKIIKPIPMYAKWVTSQPPANGEPVGYDLMVGDWVAPYGRGQTTDIIFLKEYSKESNLNYSYRLTVSFSNPGDGIQPFLSPATRFPDQGSALRSPHTAPEDGYQPAIIQENSRNPGQLSRFDFDENRNYFFRVRTVLDDKGNIRSALYGKIYGDFMRFRYYLNPTSNDRNIEFDPKHNLLKGLKPTEQVNVP